MGSEPGGVGGVGCARKEQIFWLMILRRFGIIEKNGPLVLGNAKSRFAFAEEPPDGESTVLDDYLRLDFGILPRMTLVEAAKKSERSFWRCRGRS